MSHMSNRPAGRLIPVFAVDDGLWSADLVLALSRTAAAGGESVLVLDQMGGRLMQQAGIVVGATLADVLHGSAQMSDAKCIGHEEDFTALCSGGADLDVLLGSLAALSLSYDWVFIGARPGCTPAHVRLAGAADAACVMYDCKGDRFMRAYWMLDAIRAHIAKFDPLMIAQISQEGCESDGLETYELLASTVSDFLGAPPALGGIVERQDAIAALAPSLLETLRQTGNAPQRLATG